MAAHVGAVMSPSAQFAFLFLPYLFGYKTGFTPLNNDYK